jgi:starvation-inducible DNA-binding protein
MSMTQSRMFKTSIDIANRTALIEMLNARLADAFDLFSQTKQAHWNVKGPQFMQLHELFDDLAANILPHTDSIAERATALGGSALGTARLAAAHSSLPEWPLEATSGHEHLVALAARFAHFANSLRANIDEAAALGDADSADLFTEVSRDMDKHLWFLEAHLQDR